MNDDKRFSGEIDEYIAGFSPEIQEKLIKLRQVIHDAAPEVGEQISYRMPAFVLRGYLVFFAAFKNHIGFYPTPSGIEAFKNELKGFKTAKGSVQFPNDKPLPYELIGEMVKFRAAENIQKNKTKKL